MIFRILILTFHFFILSVQSQTIQVKGKVCEKNGAPVPFATVYILKTSFGAMCDENGEFAFTLPSLKQTDTLFISAIGYKHKYLSANNIISEKTNKIILEPVEFYQLNEIVIKPKIPVTIGTQRGRSDGGYYWEPGFIIARYFKNNDNKSGYINKVSFYVKKQGKPSSMFRVRIYSVDTVLMGKRHQERMRKKHDPRQLLISISQKDDTVLIPGNDILLENLFASGTSGNEWVTVDISKYNIKIPENGFFVGMEWIYQPKGNYCDHKYDSGINRPDLKDVIYMNHHPRGFLTDIPCNQVLGATLESKERLTRIWSNYNKWQRFWVRPKTGVWNAMIRAEVLE